MLFFIARACCWLMFSWQYSHSLFCFHCLCLVVPTVQSRSHAHKIQIPVNDISFSTRHWPMESISLFKPFLCAGKAQHNITWVSITLALIPIAVWSLLICSRFLLQMYRHYQCTQAARETAHGSDKPWQFLCMLDLRSQQASDFSDSKLDEHIEPSVPLEVSPTLLSVVASSWC